MENETEKKKRGGARAGAGRRPLVNGEHRKGRNLRATDYEWEVIKKISALLKDGGKEAKQIIKIANIPPLE